MNDATFGSWSVAESPVTIEYSLVVIEEIRHAVAEGFQRLSRGGIEVGGVLYGTRQGNAARVTAMRPIACEHARGPSFQLSDKDRVELNQQLMEDRADPRLEGLESLGWFLSHTRSNVTLSDSDLEIYSIFFPHPWQVTLVVHPGRGGNMRAGFFVREADGAVKGEHSHLEFNFPDRLAGVLPADRPPRERGYGGERRIIPNLPRAEATAVAAERWQPPAPDPLPLEGPQFVSLQEPSRKWLWLVGWAVVVLVGAVLGLRYLMLHTGTEPVSLTVVERDGQLQIEWNHSARSVTGALRGSLDIIDGADTRIIALTPKVLAGGKVFYVRKTGDVEVRITVESADGRSLQEASRFLGLPPAGSRESSEDLTALKTRRDELEAEVLRLRQQNNAGAARIQQLERTLRILETRLSVDQGRQQ